MDAILPALYASPPEPLGFGPALVMRAFLLRRERGNLLIYRSAALQEEARAIRDLGGISRQYLNHHHEASPACDWVASTFSAPLHCHAADAPAVARICNVAGTFTDRHHLDDDFEVIPTPGHTPGATAYLWDTGEHRVLFTGDTIFFRRGEWVGAGIDGLSDQRPYIESLGLIRELDFDLVVPGIASEGEPFVAHVEKAEARRNIDGIIERLRRGESG